VTGRVVKVRTGARDHRIRSTWFAYGYMLVEGMIRELAGSRFVIGNCVVVDAGDGVCAVLAHMQQGSAAVRQGDDLRAGDVVGRCGNSGNSSEPHVHVQLMDHRWPYVAAGLPFVFTDVSIDGSAPTDGLPVNEAIMSERSERVAEDRVEPAVGTSRTDLHAHSPAPIAAPQDRHHVLPRSSGPRVDGSPVGREPSRPPPHRGLNVSTLPGPSPEPPRQRSRFPRSITQHWLGYRAPRPAR
jgi:murein DD-endopeptidase MepM/ murein hydrolase activator NlpD